MNLHWHTALVFLFGWVTGLLSFGFFFFVLAHEYIKFRRRR